MELVRQKNIATVITFPIIDADGDTVTGATGLDSESTTWADGSTPGAFADVTNEATEIGTTGVYHLSLTAGELNFDYIYVQIKTTSSGAKTQHILINTMVGDPLNRATTDDGGTINVTAGAIDTVTTTGTATAVTTVNGLAAGVITAASIAADAITAAKVATGAIDADALAADAVDEIWAKAAAEPAGVPAVTATAIQTLSWLLVLSRNKITQTATTQLVRNDADAATIATSTVSDDGTTAIRGEFV